MIEIPMRRLTAEELRQEYIQHSIEIARVQAKRNDYLYKISELLGRQRDLEKVAGNLDRCDERIRELENGRRDIGWLRVGDRLNHEEEIMNAKNRKSNEIDALWQKHDVTPDEIPERWQEMEKELGELKAEQDRLPRLDRLIEKKAEAGRQYQEALKREETREKQPEQTMSHNDRMAVARAENELEKLARAAERNGREIKNEKDPERERELKLEMKM